MWSLGKCSVRGLDTVLREDPLGLAKTGDANTDSRI